MKRFRVWHDECAMKVGTDGVLIGAWCPLAAPASILDVGSGSGLVSLMLAQRFPQASVTGVEIDTSSHLQSVRNASESPFANRLHMVNADFFTLDGTAMFDAIVSNPPFYEEAVLPPDLARSTARHTAGFSLERFVHRASALLNEGGQFCVVIPKASETRMVGLCLDCGMFLSHRLSVKTVARKAPKRVLLAFSKEKVAAVEEATLVLQGADGNRTPEYAALCRDFYL